MSLTADRSPRHQINERNRVLPFMPKLYARSPVSPPLIAANSTGPILSTTPTVSAVAFSTTPPPASESSAAIILEDEFNNVQDQTAQLSIPHIDRALQRRPGTSDLARDGSPSRCFRTSPTVVNSGRRPCLLQNSGLACDVSILCSTSGHESVGSH